LLPLLLLCSLASEREALAPHVAHWLLPLLPD
jgi:hypothetical protein